MILTSNINWEDFLRFLSLYDKEIVRRFDSQQLNQTTSQFIKLFKEVFPNDSAFNHIFLSIALRVPRTIQPLLILRSKLIVAYKGQLFFLSGSLTSWKDVVIELLTNCEDDIDIFNQEVNAIVRILESLDKNCFDGYSKIEKYGNYFALVRK